MEPGREKFPCSRAQPEFLSPSPDSKQGCWGYCALLHSSPSGATLVITVMGGVGPREMKGLYKGDNGKSPICGQVPFTGSLKGQGGDGQSEWG